jgi:hypothetical protein
MLIAGRQLRRQAKTFVFAARLRRYSAGMAGSRFRQQEIKMQVMVNCDDHICCDDELIRRVEGVIAGTLAHFGEHLSLVEVWLRDLNSEEPGGRDKVCSLEARIAGAAPVNTEHEAPTLAEAIHVAAGKLERLVERQLRTVSVPGLGVSP